MIEVIDNDPGFAHYAFLYNASKQKYNANCKGAAAHDLLKYQVSLEAAPYYPREKSKTVPGTHNMQHVSILHKSVTLHQNNIPRLKITS